MPEKKTAKKLSFEEAMARLEEIITAMERGEAPLEESLAQFEEGTKLLKQCTTMLEQAEQKVTKLTRSQDGSPRETPFGEALE